MKSEPLPKAQAQSSLTNSEVFLSQRFKEYALLMETWDAYLKKKNEIMIINSGIEKSGEETREQYRTNIMNKKIVKKMRTKLTQISVMFWDQIFSANDLEVMEHALNVIEQQDSMKNIPLFSGFNASYGDHSLSIQWWDSWSQLSENWSSSQSSERASWWSVILRWMDLDRKLTLIRVNKEEPQLVKSNGVHPGVDDEDEAWITNNKDSDWFEWKEWLLTSMSKMNALELESILTTDRGCFLWSSPQAIVKNLEMAAVESLIRCDVKGIETFEAIMERLNRDVSSDSTILDFGHFKTLEPSWTGNERAMIREYYRIVCHLLESKPKDCSWLIEEENPEFQNSKKMEPLKKTRSEEVNLLVLCLNHIHEKMRLGMDPNTVNWEVFMFDMRRAKEILERYENIPFSVARGFESSCGIKMNEASQWNCWIKVLNTWEVDFGLSPQLLKIAKECWEVVLSSEMKQCENHAELTVQMMTPWKVIKEQSEAKLMQWHSFGFQKISLMKDSDWWNLMSKRWKLFESQCPWENWVEIQDFRHSNFKFNHENSGQECLPKRL